MQSPANILVTGGTGFFGRALLRYWSQCNLPELAGAQFTFLSRDPERFLKESGDLTRSLNIRFVRGDIQRVDTLPDAPYTHILHAAADSTQGLSLSPLQRFDQIVGGTRNLLELARRSESPRFLLTSSGGVYGDMAAFPCGVPETHHGLPDPLEPQNAYSVGKRQAEHLCALYQDAFGVGCVIARCFAFLGEDLPLDAHFAVGNFVRSAIEGTDIVVNGDGAPIRSYLDQRDLARWLTVLLFHGQPGQAYNVGSDEQVTIGALALRVAQLTGNRSKVRLRSMAIGGQAAKRNLYVPDVSKAREHLQLRVTYDLNAGLSYMLAALKGISRNSVFGN